jgi:hypothetical protein
MARHKTRATYDETGKQNGQEHVPFTGEEEALADIESATWEEERPAREMAMLRVERNALLVFSDWTQYNDSPVDDTAKTNWAEYRQLLRDLPATEADPTNPSWPEAPE